MKYKYITHEIRKKDGSLRLIKEPDKYLKIEQTYIHRLLINNNLNCVHGFREQRGIITNALCHIEAIWSWHVDIAGFFPSINYKLVKNLLKKQNIPPHYGPLMVDNDELPQGSPASPKLANLAAYELDVRLMGLASKCGIVYTRYADDLTFSSNFSVDITKLSSVVIHIIQSCGFKVKNTKTHLVLGRYRSVTGILINNGELSIPENIKRLIQELSILDKKGKLSVAQKQQFTGLKAFANSILRANNKSEL